jgi:ribosomal protein L37E
MTDVELDNIKFDNIDVHEDFKSGDVPKAKTQILCICGHKYYLDDMKDCSMCGNSYKKCLSKYTAEPIIPAKKSCQICASVNMVYEAKHDMYFCQCGAMEPATDNKNAVQNKVANCDECGLASLELSNELGMYSCVSCGGVEDIDHVNAKLQKISPPKSKYNSYGKKYSSMPYSASMMYNPLFKSMYSNIASNGANIPGSMPALEPVGLSNEEKLAEMSKKISKLKSYYTTSKQKISNTKNVIDPLPAEAFVVDDIPDELFPADDSDKEVSVKKSSIKDPADNQYNSDSAGSKEYSENKDYQDNDSDNDIIE